MRDDHGLKGSLSRRAMSGATAGVGMAATLGTS